jgi:hypothetical protein
MCSALFWTAVVVTCTTTQIRYSASVQEDTSPLHYCSIDIAATGGLPTEFPGYAAYSVLKQKKLHDLAISACATDTTSTFLNQFYPSGSAPASC